MNVQFKWEDDYNLTSPDEKIPSTGELSDVLFIHMCVLFSTFPC